MGIQVLLLRELPMGGHVIFYFCRLVWWVELPKISARLSGPRRCGFLLRDARAPNGSSLLDELGFISDAADASRHLTGSTIQAAMDTLSLQLESVDRSDAIYPLRHRSARFTPICLLK